MSIAASYVGESRGDSLSPPLEINSSPKMEGGTEGSEGQALISPPPPTPLAREQGSCTRMVQTPQFPMHVDLLGGGGGQKGKQLCLHEEQSHGSALCRWVNASVAKSV